MTIETGSVTSSASGSREDIIAAITHATSSGTPAGTSGVYAALAALVALVPVIGEWQSALANASSNMAIFSTEISQQQSALLQAKAAEIQAIKASDDKNTQKKLNDLQTDYNNIKTTYDNYLSQMQGETQKASSQATNTSNSQSGIIQEVGVIASNFWKVLTG